MRTALAILLVAVSIPAQTELRLKVHLEFDTEVEMSTVFNTTTNVLAGKMIKSNLVQFIPPSKTSDNALHTIDYSIAFKDKADAWERFNALTNSKFGKNVRGEVSLHNCPVEKSTNRFWSGCRKEFIKVW
jgi:hypothetical protein